MREQIIAEIRRLAAENDGQPPGQIAFARETGIAEHLWRGKLWPRWGDAIVEAGYSPNKWREKLETARVLNGIVAACRRYGRLPTSDEIEIHRSAEPGIPSANAIRRHFGSRSGLIAALKARAQEDNSFADIAAMLPNEPKIGEAISTSSSKPADGFVYLIKSGDFHKIGRSDDIERRIKEIRIALPDKAVLIHSIRTDDPPGIEAYWHQRFKDKRANGEWFKLSSLDISAFKKRKFQ